MSIELKRVGYWTDNAEPICDIKQAFFESIVGAILGGHGPPGLPNPRDFVDHHWLDTQQGKMEFKAVLAHLASGRVHEAYFGYSWCRICHRNDNGCKDLTDGVYVWPEGYAHYVREHAVKPPQEFIDHVMSKDDYTVMYGAPW